MKKLLSLFGWFREAMILRRHLMFLYEMHGSISLYSEKNITVFLHPTSPASCILGRGETIEEAIEAAKLELAAERIEQEAAIAQSESLAKAGATGADA